MVALVNYVEKKKALRHCGNFCTFCVLGRAQLTPVVPLPDGLGQSGLLVAVSNMPKTKILPSLVRIVFVDPFASNLVILCWFHSTSLIEHIRRRLRYQDQRHLWRALTSWLLPPTPRWTSCFLLHGVLPSNILVSRLPRGEMWNSDDVNAEWIGGSCGLPRGPPSGGWATRGRGVCCASDGGAGGGWQGTSIPTGMRSKIAPHSNKYDFWVYSHLQASILAGQNGGRAAYVAFIMEAKIEVDRCWESLLALVSIPLLQAGARIAIATTNLTPSLLGVD